MKKVKLDLYPENNNLSEIFQAVDIKFSYVIKKTGNIKWKELHPEGEYKQVTEPCKCRDFLGDVLWSRARGEVASIYGFKYDYTKNPIDDDVLRLSIKFPVLKIKEIFLKNLSNIHEKEKIAGVALTKVFETEDKNTLIVEAAPEWMDTIWKLSMYTLYIKFCSYESPEHFSTPESSYISRFTKEVESRLLTFVKEPSNVPHDAKWPDYIGEAHNHHGVISLISRVSCNPYVDILN